MRVCLYIYIQTHTAMAVLSLSLYIYIYMYVVIAVFIYIYIYVCVCVNISTKYTEQGCENQLLLVGRGLGASAFQVYCARLVRTLPIVSIVVPFWGYLLGSSI